MAEYILRKKKKQKVVGIEDFRKVWLSAPAKCSFCHREWVATFHIDRDYDLECPRCRRMKGQIIE